MRRDGPPDGMVVQFFRLIDTVQISFPHVAVWPGPALVLGRETDALVLSRWLTKGFSRHDGLIVRP